MKKSLSLLFLIFAIACKDNKTNEGDKPKESKIHYNLVKNYNSTDIEAWKKTRVDLGIAPDANFGEVVYILNRNSTTESAYLSSTPILVNYASDYRVSIIVKKGLNSKVFGLRLSGSYPDRADAIFDLDKGIVIKDKASRDFENSSATIEKLSDGWYKCSLKAEVAADDLRITIGATDLKRSVDSWEGKTETLCDVYIVPSSITLEEVILN